MEETIKIWLGGGIRLDAPFYGLSPERARTRRREMREELLSLLTRAAQEKVSYLVFMGNLFYEENLSFETAEFLINAFEKQPELRIILLPGHTDAAHPDAFYLSGRLPQNVSVFTDAACARFDFPEVSFYASASANPAPALFADKRAASDGRLQVLLAYAEAPDDALLSAARDFSADVTVYGGIPSPASYVKETRPLVLFTGFAVGHTPEELDFGSFTSLTATRGHDGYLFSLDRIPYARRRYLKKDLDLTGVRSLVEVQARIDSTARELDYAGDTHLLLRLTGDIPVDMLLPATPEADGLYALTIIDDTVPSVGTDALLREMSVRGELYRSLAGGFSAEESDDRRAIIEAFRLGLQAIDDRSDA